MSFDKEYSRLNPEQKRAVTVIDGPVLVIAGPGTGKTQLLSMRVANILKKTDTAAANILCLTFTNKAATNMRERLVSLIGPTARDVSAKTFHSFAAELMNQYPDHFWSGARLATAPDAVQLEIVETILRELPLDNPLALKFAGEYTAIGAVQEALKLAKEAGLTPGRLKALIKANIAFIEALEPKLITTLDAPLSYKNLGKLAEQIHDLPDQPTDKLTAPLLSLTSVIKQSFEQAVRMDQDTNKTVNTGKWKKRLLQIVDGQKGMFDERRRNQWWLAVADVYDTYRSELRRRGYYDYADMLVEVITELQNSPEMLANVQERYLYVLIDEFQDTNAAQLRLAHLVADHNAADGAPNLMAVGDDDQSIYKFNGAELNNLLSFERMYPTTQRIVLKDNYRSSQLILDASKKIIEQAEDRLVKRDKSLNKNLTAVNEPRQKSSVKHLSFPTLEHQQMGIAREVAKLRAEGQGRIAILARSHDSLEQLASILLRLKVPVQYERQSNILDHEAVQQVCLLAELAVAIKTGNKQAVNEKTARTLLHPMWEIAPKDLWDLAVTNYAEPDWLNSLISSDNPKLAAIGQWFFWLGHRTPHMPLQLSIEYLLGLRASEHRDSPIKPYFAARQEVDDDYLHGLSAIRLLRILVSEFSHNNDPNLQDFVRFIELNRNNHKVLADESPFVSSESAVQLLTVHKAKGLEFDSVFIVDAMENIWKPRNGGRKPPMNLPLQPYGDDMDDYIRLMYVASTRARRRLVFSSYYQNHIGEPILVAPFVRTSVEAKIVPPSRLDPPVTVLEHTMRWPRLQSKDESALLKPRLENFSISVTSLLNFLDVTKGGPDYFFERNILRLPDVKTASLSHGTATHAALEEAQKLVNKNSFDLATVLQTYESALKNEHLPEQEFKRYLKQGRMLLESLFIENKLGLIPGSLTEQRIADVTIGPATISGKLDRIDLPDDKHIVVVDYKTGRPLSSFQTKDQNQVIRAWKQRTQLTFYALLTHNTARFRGKVVEGRMIYVEAERANDFTRSYSPSAEEITRLSKLVIAVWQHVKALNFPDISKYTPDYAGIAAFEEDLINNKI